MVMMKPPSRKTPPPPPNEQPYNRTIEVADLKFDHYYVADIAHHPTNPIHRCIVSDVRQIPNHGTFVSVMRSGYDPQIMPRQKTTDFAYFKIICEIEEMNPNKDSYRLPTSTEKDH